VVGICLRQQALNPQPARRVARGDLQPASIGCGILPALIRVNGALPSRAGPALIGRARGHTVRRIISIIAIAPLLTATACAPEEKTEVSCPRPENSEQILRSAQILLSGADKNRRGIYLIKIAPDSFWACAGIQEGDMITQFNSRPVSEAPEILELVELITQGSLLEFKVLDPSEDRRHIVVR
jgi:hypothetical protein